MINKDKLLVTAGGRIVCRRCQAISRHSKMQCKKPALRGKGVCGFHGGKSTGPKTDSGKKRSRNAHLKSGEFTKEAVAERNRTLLSLNYYEDLMHILKMTTSPRTRGPKPSGYIKPRTSDEALIALEHIGRPLK